MSATNYTEVDAAIVAFVASNPGTSPSSSQSLQGQVLSLADNEPVSRFTTHQLACEGMRMIDRRLQALRKSGRIKFSKVSRVWELQA